jgi:hypothetical protein
MKIKNLNKEVIRDKKGKFSNILTQRNIKLGKITLGILVFIFLVGVFYNLTKKTVNWFRLNTIVFQAPVSIQWHKPIEITSLQQLSIQEANNALISQISDDVIKQYLNPDSLPKCTDSVTQINPTTFFNDLKQKESTNGTNTNPVALHNYCANKGKWNQIGYNPQGKFCFTDEQEAKLYVAYWLKKNADGLTMNQAECYWNTGKVQDTCNYITNLGMAN